jgi:hypothetical protein
MEFLEFPVINWHFSRKYMLHIFNLILSTAQIQVKDRHLPLRGRPIAVTDVRQVRVYSVEKLIFYALRILQMNQFAAENQP